MGVRMGSGELFNQWVARTRMHIWTHAWLLYRINKVLSPSFTSHSLVMPKINLVVLYCPPSLAAISLLRHGDWNCTQYSSWGLTKVTCSVNTTSWFIIYSPTYATENPVCFAFSWQTLYRVFDPHTYYHQGCWRGRRAREAEFGSKKKTTTMSLPLLIWGREENIFR